MKKYYLAVDIGASSGRHILGHLENGQMVLEEIHRFPNGNVEKDGELTWDIDGLFQEILTGMKKCKEAGKIPLSVGIDTWAVDIVLLDEKDKIDDRKKQKIAPLPIVPRNKANDSVRCKNSKK